MAAKIMSLVPPAEKAPTFVDAFLGGGSISLLAKAKGYCVLCNDISERSYIIGKALIENSTQKISDEEIARLFIPQVHNSFIQSNYSPDLIVSHHARFLDNAFMNVKKEDFRLRLLLIKYVLRTRPMGNFVGGHRFIRYAENKDFDEANARFLQKIKNIIKLHPFKQCKIIQYQINCGIFDNSKSNQVFKQDVFEFLKSIQGDIVYFDPPYYGATTYEDYYHALDCILEGRIFEKQNSVFNSRQWLEFMDRLFKSAQHIPIWVLSHGKAADEKVLLDLMSKYRKCKAIKVKHRWSINNMVRKDQQDINEILIHGN